MAVSLPVTRRPLRGTGGPRHHRRVRRHGRQCHSPRRHGRQRLVCASASSGSRGALGTFGVHATPGAGLFSPVPLFSTSFSAPPRPRAPGCHQACPPPPPRGRFWRGPAGGLLFHVKHTVLYLEENGKIKKASKLLHASSSDAATLVPPPGPASSRPGVQAVKVVIYRT
jgi:hypothetical protein